MANTYKKTIFSLIITLLVFPAIAQVYFYEDFEGITISGRAGDIPEGWTLYNDNNTPHTTFSYINEAWKVVRLADGNKKAVSTSWFTNTNARADRWMITPSIDLTDAVNPYLIFEAQSGDVTDRDSYMVKLSTTDVLKDDFSEALLTVQEENYVTHIRAVSLEEFKNEHIHIAFILNSLRKYSLYIDNIRVLDLDKPIVSLSNLNAPVIISIDTDVEITASAYAMYYETIHSYTINYTLNDGEPIKTVVDNQTIDNLNSFTITVPAFTLNEDKIYDFKLWLSDFNGIENIQSDTLEQRIEVTENTYYPRKTLLENFSSSTCGPCANANPYIKKAYTALNANSEETDLYVIKYQVNTPAPGDPAVTDESLYRYGYYQIKGVPQLFINGLAYSPGKWAEMENDLPERVSQQLNNKTPFWLEASMERSGNHYKVDVTVKNTGAYNDALLYVAFIEDSISHNIQTNGETQFFHIFRKYLPSAYGEKLSFTESGENTYSFEYTFDGENPKIFNTLDSLSAIVFLKDENTTEILQSTYIAPVKSNTIGINVNTSDNFDIQITPNPSNGKCKLFLSLNKEERIAIELYSQKGGKVMDIPYTYFAPGKHEIELSLMDQPAGIYFIRLIGDSGVKTEKIILL